MATPLVVVAAAPGPVTAAVRDVLRDWAALGLVQPFLWLDTAEVDVHGSLSAVVCAHVTDRSAGRVRLQSALADTEDIGVLRLVALGTLGARPSLVAASTASYLNTGLSASSPGRLSALQVVLTRQGAGGWRSGFELPGWRTLVVSPEDAFSPDRAAIELLEDADATEPTAHAAAVLAAVTGLWTGMAATAFDDSAPGASPFPQVVRAYLRRLDVSPVTSCLRDLLTDVSHGLPRPQTPQGPCALLNAPGPAAVQLATAVLAQHSALFAVPTAALDPHPREQVGPLAALAQFFRFVLTALRRAPADLGDAVRTRAARGVSSRVQEALYGGGDSRFEVVTRGLNAQGLPAGITEIGDLAQEVAQRIDPLLATEQSQPDLSGLWRDVVGGGLTLADAGYERLPDIPPLVVDGLPGVVADSAWVAPAPADAFVLTGGSATRVGTTRVAPYDLRVHDHVEQVLAGATGDDPDAARQREAFRGWRERMAGSYTGAVGRRLTSEVEQRAQRLAGLLEQLRAGRSQDDDRVLEREQALVRRAVRDFLLTLLLVGLVVTVVLRWDLVRGRSVAGLATGVVVAGAAVAVRRVLRHQAKVFAILNSRLHADRELELAGRNLGHAATALHLASTLYQQYLCWAPVLGRFLREPFGPQPAAVPPMRVDGVLPRAVGFGVVLPDRAAVAAVAQDLAPAVFERRWLSELWQALLDDAPDRLGPQGQPVRQDPRALLGDTARDPGGPLRRWSQDVAAAGVAHRAGDALWERARAALLSGGFGRVLAQLCTQVEVQAQSTHGATGPRAGRAFFSELTDSLVRADTHHVLPGLFSPQAQGAGAHAVSETVVTGDPLTLGTGTSPAVTWLAPVLNGDHALDQFLVVVQTTAPVSSALLRLEGGVLAAVPAGVRAEYEHEMLD